MDQRSGGVAEGAGLACMHVHESATWASGIAKQGLERTSEACWLSKHVASALRRSVEALTLLAGYLK